MTTHVVENASTTFTLAELTYHFTLLSKKFTATKFNDFETMIFAAVKPG